MNVRVEHIDSTQENPALPDVGISLQSDFIE